MNAPVLFAVCVCVCVWQDKKAQKRRERLGSGPAFEAHRVGCATKLQDKLKQLQDSATRALKKIKEASKGLQAHEADAVTRSYTLSANGAETVGTLWLTDELLPDDCIPDGDEMWKSRAAPVGITSLKSKLHESMAEYKQQAGLNLVKDSTKLVPFLHFKWHALIVTKCPSLDITDDIMAAHKDQAGEADVFIRGLNKIATDITNYLAQLKRKADNDLAKRKKEEEKQAIAEANKIAKNAASKVKKGGKAVNPIFQVPAEKWRSVYERKVADELTADMMALPWIVKGSDQVSVWKSQNNMAMKLNEFAGQYKRAQSFKDDGRSQAPIVPRQGREETQALYQQLMKNEFELDISGVQGGFDFMKSCWFFGYDAKLEGAWLAPNCAAMAKVLVLGEIHAIAFDLTDLVKVCGENCNCDDLVKFVLSLTPESPHWASVTGYRVTVQANDMLYLPQGWILCEQCASSMLVYGVRRSFLVNLESAKANYELAIALLQRSNRDPAKMQEVLKCYASQ